MTWQQTEQTMHIDHREPVRRTGLIEWTLFGLALLIIGGYVGQLLYSDYQRIDAEERQRLAAAADVVEQNLARQLFAVDRSLAGFIERLSRQAQSSVAQ